MIIGPENTFAFRAYEAGTMPTWAWNKKIPVQPEV
jgi:hypothetical protein